MFLKKHTQLIVYFLFSKIVTIGLNATLRSLEAGNVDLLIISACIKPKYVVDQTVILAIAKNKNIKILCIQRLNELLTDAIGFSSCLCISFADISKYPQLNAVWKTASLLTDRFPIPKHFKRQTTEDELSVPMDTEPMLKKKRELSPIHLNDIYLCKKSSGRSFVPAGTVFRTAKPNEWSDFISLGEPVKQPASRKTGGSEQPLHHKRSNAKKSKPIASEVRNSYVTLTVNKVQGNPNKVKTNKIKQFK